MRPTRWLLLLWLVPLGFLAAGQWPVGLFPMLVLTLWVFLRGNDEQE